MSAEDMDTGNRKRVRRQGTDDPTSTQRGVHESATDCYDQIVSNGNFNDEDSGGVRQSWLISHRWFSEHHSIDATSPTQRSSGIQSLQRQLIQIKRRLLPAAQNAADAYNAYIDQMDHLPERTPHNVFQIARRACNPVEVLGEGRAGGMNDLFVNRSAVKLANLNASIGFVLTQPAESGAFNFVDLCAAPGGFSEYLFHHCTQNYAMQSAVRGFGMSLIGTNEHGRGTDWKVENYATQAMQYRICTGIDGTGDIYNWDNVLALVRGINSVPIHAVVCDGGVDAQRDHEHQEQLAQKLVLCQAAAAMSVLAPGGSLVLKLFGCQSDTMRTMMKDLGPRFHDFMIKKPISSRPASGERYLVMVGFHGLPSDFDGRKWRDTMLLGMSPANPSIDEKVESYLDMIDYAMLTLNIRACFSILSKMERMVRQFEECEVDDEYGVDVMIYRQAWRL